MCAQQTILASTDEIDRWSACNLRQAFLSALVMQPARFTEHDLFMTIAGLSYSGDIRMHIGRRARIMMCASRVFTVPPDPGMGENPRKVANIVNVNRDGFRRLYAPCFEYADRLGYLRSVLVGSVAPLKLTMRACLGQRQTGPGSSASSTCITCAACSRVFPTTSGTCASGSAEPSVTQRRRHRGATRWYLWSRPPGSCDDASGASDSVPASGKR